MPEYEIEMLTVGVLQQQTIPSVRMSRERFMEIVERELEDIDDLLPETKAELRETAQTMPRFPIGSWQDPERGCGCVVGEYLIASSELSRLELAQNLDLVNYWKARENVCTLLDAREDAYGLRKFGIEIDGALRDEIVPAGNYYSIEIGGPACK